MTNYSASVTILKKYQLIQSEEYNRPYFFIANKKAVFLSFSSLIKPYLSCPIYISRR